LNLFTTFSDELVNRWHVLDASVFLKFFQPQCLVGAAAKPSQRIKPLAGAIGEVEHRRPPEKMYRADIHGV
jgi:hypothetical protein